MKNFINISDISKNELRLILDNAKSRKEKRSKLNKNAIDHDTPLDGKILIMIFEKPSMRTRISFDLAVKQLGGKSLILNPNEIHYGSGNESLYDTAKILSQYADVVMLRTYAHKKVLDFSKYLVSGIKKAISIVDQSVFVFFSSGSASFFILTKLPPKEKPLYNFTL